MISPLRAARLSRGLSLEAVGAEVGLDKSQLSRIERTGRTSRENAEKLASLFNLSEERIFFPERYPPRG